MSGLFSEESGGIILPSMRPFPDLSVTSPNKKPDQEIPSSAFYSRYDLMYIYNFKEPNTYPDDMFHEALNLIPKHDLIVGWHLNRSDRSRAARQTLYATAKDEICVYTYALDDILLNQLAKPLHNNLKINVLCDALPDIHMPPFQTLSYHIEKLGYGSITRATADSRAVISENLTKDHSTPHFLLTDQKNFLVDKNRDGSAIGVIFNGKQRSNKKRLQAFQAAAHVGDNLTGSIGPKPKQSFWAF